MGMSGHNTKISVRKLGAPRFTTDPEAAMPSEVITYKLSREEIEAKYGLPENRQASPILKIGNVPLKETEGESVLDILRQKITKEEYLKRKEAGESDWKIMKDLGTYSKQFNDLKREWGLVNQLAPVNKRRPKLEQTSDPAASKPDLIIEPELASEPEPAASNPEPAPDLEPKELAKQRTRIEIARELIDMDKYLVYVAKDYSDKQIQSELSIASDVFVQLKREWGIIPETTPKQKPSQTELPKACNCSGQAQELSALRAEVVNLKNSLVDLTAHIVNVLLDKGAVSEELQKNKGILTDLEDWVATRAEKLDSRIMVLEEHAKHHHHQVQFGLFSGKAIS